MTAIADALNRQQPNIDSLVSWLTRKKEERERRERIGKMQQFFAPHDVMNPGEAEKAARVNQLEEIPVNLGERETRMQEASIPPPARAEGPMARSGERPQMPTGIEASYPRKPVDLGMSGPQATTQRRTLADTPTDELVGMMGETTRANPEDIMNLLFAQEAQKAKTAQAYGMKGYESSLREGREGRLEKQKASDAMARQAEALKHRNPNQYQLYLDAAGGDESLAIENIVRDNMKERGASHAFKKGKDYPLLKTVTETVKNTAGQDVQVPVDYYGYKDKEGNDVITFRDQKRLQQGPPGGKGKTKPGNIRDMGAGATAGGTAAPAKKTVSLKAIRAQHPDATETDDELKAFYQGEGYEVTP